jgi:uncharacterized protein
MWILLVAVATASLMGSLHCVGMCGPLALWAAGAERAGQQRTVFLPTILYHAGRAVTYSLAGLIAGTIGGLVDWSGNTLGIQLLAARVVGGVMVVAGLFSLARLLKARISKNIGRSVTLGSTSKSSYLQPKPNWITAQLLRFRPTVFKLPLAWRALSVGLLTALLPCGWLYLFAMLAAATGDMVAGALVMLAFWLGSLPLLVMLVAGTQLLRGRVGRIVPVAGSLVLVLAGAYTASGRGFANLQASISASSVLLDRLKDGKAVNQLDQTTIDRGMSELVTTTLPCCQSDTDASPHESSDDTVALETPSLVNGSTATRGPLP